jgi:hypothetical protein
MNANEIKSQDRVHAVINLNSEDFYWMLPPDGKADDKLVAVEAIVHHASNRDSEDLDTTAFVLDGGEYGVFEAPTTQIFKTRSEAKSFIREQERERALKMLNETATLHGMLRFLVTNDAIKLPEDSVARAVLYTHLEDAGLGDRIPTYALADV